MTEPVSYTRYSQRVWTNANLAKDFVKVKTYSKARAEPWMNMYSILDRSTFEESCVRPDRGITVRFPSRKLSDRRSADLIRGQCF
jgi:hypothetical protein